MKYFYFAPSSRPLPALMKPKRGRYLTWVVDVDPINDVSDISVHEDLARKHAHDLICRNTAVRTTDPEKVRRLLPGQLLEEVRLLLGHVS
jgi:hypothetical protein